MNKGSISIHYLLFILLVFMGILLVNGLGMQSNQNTSPTPTPAGPPEKLLPPDNFPTGMKSLQLQTLYGIPITIPPPATNDCNNGSITSGESNILYYISPDPGKSVGAGGKIKIFYTDELPLTLGVGNGVSSYSTSNHISSPTVGDKSKKDGNGFPYFPALYLTDTSSNANDKSGDVQQGGFPNTPNDIYGTWRIGTPDRTPPALSNGHTLPSGADPWPSATNVKISGNYKGLESQYSSEIIWDVNTLVLKDGVTKLKPGDTYRAQFIVHDGDQYQFPDFPDIAEGCTAIND